MAVQVTQALPLMVSTGMCDHRIIQLMICVAGYTTGHNMAKSCQAITMPYSVRRRMLQCQIQVLTLT